MKPIIDYAQSGMQMGDLIRSQGVSLKQDFSPDERREIRRQLEYYLSSTCGDKPVIVDLKKCYIRIKGYDEAGYLLQYFC